MILELCKGVHCVDLGESFQTHIYLRNLASIQQRTSLVKFARSLACSVRSHEVGPIETMLAATFQDDATVVDRLRPTGRTVPNSRRSYSELCADWDIQTPC